MEHEPSLETVQQALTALYFNPDTSGKEKASIWLGELQKSVFAWQIADQLLLQNQCMEFCYFAVQTMRTKIQLSFHELPPDSHESLRDSLLNHVNKLSPETQPAILTQLSLAVADLALQMATWKNAVLDLIQKFGNNTILLPFLMEVLTVLPEEINSRSLRLGANRRTEITEELSKSSPVVLELLSSLVHTDNAALQARIFKVLGSWISIGAIPEESIINTDLLKAPFLALANRHTPTPVHSAATDCLCSALFSAEDMSRNRQLACALFEGVLTLTEAYHYSVADEDVDKSMNYCRIFSEMAESFLEPIVTSPNQGLGDFKTLELLLICVGHFMYEVAEITFNFWYRLSEDLYQKNKPELNELFKPYVQRLVSALCHHCEMDTDHEGIPDDSGDFGEFRLRVSELIKDIVFIMGSSVCFGLMFENLRSSNQWEISEASLFVMTAVAKNILPQENDIVPQVLQAILSLPDTSHLSVRYTSIQMVGELAEWIEHHPQLLDPVLQFLLAGLQQQPLASVAATALQSVCTQCRDQMTAHFAGLLQIVKAMDSFHLSTEAAIGLLKGTSTILGRLEHSQVTEGLRELCAFQVKPLSELLVKDGEALVQGSPNDPIMWLDRLAAIFRYTNPIVNNGQAHPCQPVIMEIWPVLSKACEKYQADVRVIERCCRCIRFAIRRLGKDSVTILNALVTQIVTLYQVHQHSCFLYLGSILVDEYGTEPGCVPGLLNMLQAFCGPTFRMLDQHSGLRNHPDTVDDLFRLCLRFIQRCPVPFLQSSMAKALLCCALAACSLDHKDANASVMKFLNDFIGAAREKEDREDFEERRSLVKELLNDHGQALVMACINAVLFCLPSYMIPDVAEVLYQLALVDRASFCVWLESTLKALPKEGSGGAITATYKQLADFHKSVTSAESFKDVSYAMKDFARLFR